MYTQNVDQYVLLADRESKRKSYLFKVLWIVFKTFNLLDQRKYYLTMRSTTDMVAGGHRTQLSHNLSNLISAG